MTSSPHGDSRSPGLPPTRGELAILHVPGECFRDSAFPRATPGPQAAPLLRFAEPGDELSPRLRGHAAAGRDASGDAGIAGLEHDIRELAAAHGVRPGLLIVTGNLAASALPDEYTRAAEALGRLADALGIPRRHVAIVPGDSDVNRDACHAHFLTQASLGKPPVPPYFPKWGQYAAAFAGFYAEAGHGDPANPGDLANPGGRAGHPGAQPPAFHPDEPWSLFEMPGLFVVVAGLNSTMALSHRAEGQHAELTGAQLGWFAPRLAACRRQGWVSVAAIHHAPRYLRDGAALHETLIAPGLVQLVVDGDAGGARPESADAPVQHHSESAAAWYELIVIRADGITRHRRRRADADWTGEQATTEALAAQPPAQASADVSAGRDELAAGRPGGYGERDAASPARSASLFAGRDAALAGRDIVTNFYEMPPDPGAGHGPDRADTFLDRVAEAARLRFPNATITEVTRGESRYLRVSDVPGSGTAEIWPVGAIEGPVTDAALDAFGADVHSQFAAADPGVRSELVYSGPAAPAELVRRAQRMGVRLRSFVEYQGLMDLRPLAQAQQARLAADRVYPAGLYVDQRYTVVSGTAFNDPATGPEVRDGLIGQAVDWLSADDARLIVVLGDFGRGKTSFLRQLTRRLPAELPGLIPVLVELRTLEKGPTLADLLAQHLVRHGVEDVSQAKLRYMVDSGRVALLFDGFDELELRVGYDSAADYLQTLLNSVTGQAKVILTSRTQHFRSTRQVRTALGQGPGPRTDLGERVETRAGSRVVILADFTEAQILAFLTNLYEGDAARAGRRLELIGHIAGLLELTRNPRMLGFVAELDEARLLAVQAEGGQLSAASLYEEIIDYWLASEEQRQSHRRGLQALTKDERFTACTALALRLWRTMAPAISRRELTAEVTAALTRLAERGFSDEEAAHSIASGSLLVRTDDDAFTFIHQSIMEWLVAARAARDLATGGTAEILHTRQMSRLMAAFFADLAGRDAASSWAARTILAARASEAAKQNALAVSDYFPVPVTPVRQAIASPDDMVAASPDDAVVIIVGTHADAGDDRTEVRAHRQDLGGVDLRSTDLTGRNLHGASLRGAVLRGMRLVQVNLTGADLTGADLTGVLMTGGSLRGARLAGSRWDRAALLDVAGTETADLVAVLWLAGAAIPGRDTAEPVIEPPGAAGHCVAYSPGGALLAYGAGTVAKIADAATGRTLRVLRGHRALVTSVAFSPDGSQVATASQDREARTWNAATGALLVILSGHEGYVSSVAWSPDGSRIATASTDRTACTWDAATGERRSTLTGHDDSVRAAAWSPDGTRIATASTDGTVRIWAPEGGTHLDAFVGHSEASQELLTSMTSGAVLVNTQNAHAITSLAWSPDGTRIATASTDRTARIWDYTTHTFTTLTGHTRTVRSIAWSPHGTTIATASDDYTACIWNPAIRTPLATLADHTSAVTAVAWSPDGTRIATASDDRTACTWDLGTTTVITRFTGQRDPVTAVAWSPDGTHIATASRDKTARTWDIATGQPRAALAGHRDAVTAIAWSPDGTRIATASRDVTARTWDPGTGQHHKTFIGHDSLIRAVAWSPDATRIATTSQDNTARIWDVATGRSGISLSHGRHVQVHGIAWSPDGTRIATASADHTARIWDAATGEHYATLGGHTATVHAVAWSPDGARVATASQDNTAQVYKLSRLRAAWMARLMVGKPLLGASVVLRGHQGFVNDVAFAPDGDVLATASDDGTVRLWGADGDPLATLAGHDGPVTSLAFAPNGDLLATASSDGTIRLWMLTTPQRLTGSYFWTPAATESMSTTLAATLMPLRDKGYAVLLPDGSYKLAGDPGGRLWWAMKLHRFEPGELDPYVPEIRRQRADAPILPRRDPVPGPPSGPQGGDSWL